MWQLACPHPILYFSSSYQWVPPKRKITAILPQDSPISKILVASHMFFFEKNGTSIQLLLISVSINSHLPCINCVWPMDQWPLALAFHGSEPPFQSWCLSHGQFLVLHKPSFAGYVFIVSLSNPCNNPKDFPKTSLMEIQTWVFQT